MSSKSADDILKSMLEAAANRWNTPEIDKMRQTLEDAAKAVCEVEEFPLKTEEEPFNPTAILLQWSQTKSESAKE